MSIASINPASPSINPSYGFNQSVNLLDTSTLPLVSGLRTSHKLILIPVSDSNCFMIECFFLCDSFIDTIALILSVLTI